MQPKYIWPWTFPDFAVSKFLAIFSIVAFLIAISTKKLDASIYRNKQNFVLLAMWILIHLSEIFSPYPVYFAGVRAEIVLDAFNTIFIMYFVGLGLLSNVEHYKKSLLYMATMFALITVYYVYWANSMYLDSRWDMFTGGRLNPPSGTSIGDQNALSSLIVMGMPFILLGFFYCKNIYIKLSCIGVLPLLWHSLFLFGSRGAMLAILFTTMAILKVLSNNKKSDDSATQFKYVKSFKLIITFGFVVALAYQGGAMLNRSSETAAQAQQGGDEPLNPRLISWSVGKKLVGNFPLLGAGPQRFQMASNTLYPGESVHVAHNTFLNFAANTGLPVGLFFLYLFWLQYKNFKYCVKNNIQNYPLLDYLNKACSAALFAYFISALFLDLIIFEAFYFILMLNLAKLFIFKQLLTHTTENHSHDTQGNKIRNSNGMIIKSAS
ncbi:O-antigen ligase [Paraglaciecola sp. L3A3]|uniref:O-antigen ligase family protein n=1 Tax=Paraglaciecola sp. L3A3 TaxID=2686358 RepID=UPI00131B98BF|nr:O-antigen ligase family protein [Paraglaciecola sp. L3A3]